MLSAMSTTPQTSADAPKPKLEPIHINICDVRKRSKRVPFFQYYNYGPTLASENFYNPHGPFWSMHKYESVMGVSCYLTVRHCHGRTEDGESFLRIDDSFWPKIDGFLVVYGHESKKSLVDAERVLTEFELSKETKSNIPIGLVGETTGLGDGQEVATEDAITVAHDHRAWFQQCLSRDFAAVQSIFQRLCVAVLVDRGVLTEEQVATQNAPRSPLLGPAYEDSDEQRAPRTKHNVLDRMKKFLCG